MSASDVVERALALSRADGCVVVLSETSSVDLRWAGNSLTTDGASRDRSISSVVRTLVPYGAPMFALSSRR